MYHVCFQCCFVFLVVIFVVVYNEQSHYLQQNKITMRALTIFALVAICLFVVASSKKLSVPKRCELCLQSLSGKKNSPTVSTVELCSQIVGATCKLPTEKPTVAKYSPLKIQIKLPVGLTTNKYAAPTKCDTVGANTVCKCPSGTNLYVDSIGKKSCRCVNKNLVLKPNGVCACEKKGHIVGPDNKCQAPYSL